MSIFFPFPDGRFLFPYTMPICVAIMPQPAAFSESIRAIEPSTISWVLCSLETWSMFTWQSPTSCVSEFQTSSLFPKPALSLTFWFDPHLSIPSHQFTPTTVPASCLVTTVMSLKLTWSLVLWYLATSRWPQRKKVISKHIICFHMVDFSRSHIFGITYSFRKHTEHLLL